MYCKNCGSEIANDCKVCPHCGQVVNASIGQKSNYNPQNESTIGWAILGFFLPLVGLILYLAWQSEYPKKAKSAGKGALVGFIFSIASSILSYVIFFVALGGILSTASTGVAVLPLLAL